MYRAGFTCHRPVARAALLKLIYDPETKALNRELLKLIKYIYIYIQVAGITVVPIRVGGFIIFVYWCGDYFLPVYCLSTVANIYIFLFYLHNDCVIFAFFSELKKEKKKFLRQFNYDLMRVPLSWGIFIFYFLLNK